jgi:ribosomal-protein-alanine N-acetyltransferase
VPPAWDQMGPAPDDDGDSSGPMTSEGIAGAVRVMPLRRRHLRSVVAIEEACYPRPWSATVFLSELAQRSSRRYRVATIGPLVVGFSGLMIVEEDGHITNIAVDPAWQRRSIGTVLLLDQARAAPALGVRHLTLEVRVSNTPAQTLYQHFGFAPVGVRRNYYVETGEDAIVMWARDIDSDDYARRLTEIEATLRSGP